MNDVVSISTETLRNIITSKTTYRKCPACDKSGREYWDETGTSVLPYPHPDWGDNYGEGRCQECEGLAYIPNS